MALHLSNNTKLSDFSKSMDAIDTSVAEMEKENESKVKNNTLLRSISQYGAENIFVLYRSGYNSYYYNNDTGEKFLGDPFPGLIHIEKALEEDYVDKKQLYKTIYEKEKKEIDNLYFRKNDIDNNLDTLKGIIKVTVNKGRKWKGTGYIVGQESSSYQYSPWNSTTTHFYKIYDDKDNTINTVNKDYADFKDAEDKFNEYKKYRLDLLNKSKESDIEFKDHDFILYTYDNFIDWLKNKYYNPSIDWSKAKDIEQEKQDKKSEEFKKKKMLELIEWVKNNTDKKGDEIEKLAERIFKKRYT